MTNYAETFLNGILNEDSEGEDSEEKESDEKEMRTNIKEDEVNKIKKYVISTSNINDDMFHEFVEKLGIDPSAAETLIYRCVGKMADKLKEMGVDPVKL